jgi:hypothetical protein
MVIPYDEIVIEVIGKNPGRTSAELWPYVLKALRDRGRTNRQINCDNVKLRFATVMQQLLREGEIQRIEERSEIGYSVTWWPA